MPAGDGLGLNVGRTILSVGGRWTDKIVHPTDCLNIAAKSKLARYSVAAEDSLQCDRMQHAAQRGRPGLKSKRLPMRDERNSVVVGGESPAEALARFERMALAGDSRFATEFSAALLGMARDAGASDVHLEPAADALVVRWRLDGVLHELARLPKSVSANVIARLKVLSSLLTYETALPQEGRIWDDRLRVEVRVSTFPSLYGERAVLRLLGATRESLDGLAQLGLGHGVLGELDEHLAATSGAVLVVGPAGSGKTTTAYACLRHIVAESRGGRSITSLEDPIEVAVAGVTQSQVNLSAGFDMATALRSLLRLDPEVIFIGEMRDRPTAETAMQAALTGQLVVTTFHAGSCRDAINRLEGIGIPAFAVRNAVRLVVAQRLVRRLCACSKPDEAGHTRSLGLAVEQAWLPGGCEECHHTGYRGRALVAEWGVMNQQQSLELSDEGDLWTNGLRLVQAGTTSAVELMRVLGLPREKIA